MLTVREAASFLHSHEIHCSEQMLRRWLRQGLIRGIPSQSRRSGWRIPQRELTGFLMDRSRDGTAYEVGIDDETRIRRLMEEVRELKQQIKELQDEKEELQAKLGTPPF